MFSLNKVSSLIFYIHDLNHKTIINTQDIIQLHIAKLTNKILVYQFSRPKLLLNNVILDQFKIIQNYVNLILNNKQI